jgi:hypothetical protein
MEAEEDEETKASCRTTKTILRGDKFVKDYIYKLVTATSELESRGNLIFTYALLRCNEEEALIPAKMFSQSFMTACIRTAGLRGHSTDEAVGYDPCAVCLRYMTEAKIQVGHVPGWRLRARLRARLFISVTAHQHPRSTHEHNDDQQPVDAHGETTVPCNQGVHPISFPRVFSAPSDVQKVGRQRHVPLCDRQKNHPQEHPSLHDEASRVGGVGRPCHFFAQTQPQQLQEKHCLACPAEHRRPPLRKSSHPRPDPAAQEQV